MDPVSAASGGSDRARRVHPPATGARLRRWLHLPPRQFRLLHSRGLLLRRRGPRSASGQLIAPYVPGDSSSVPHRHLWFFPRAVARRSASRPPRTALNDVVESRSDWRLSAPGASRGVVGAARAAILSRVQRSRRQQPGASRQFDASGDGSRTRARRLPRGGAALRTRRDRASSSLGAGLGRRSGGRPADAAARRRVLGSLRTGHGAEARPGPVVAQGSAFHFRNPARLGGESSAVDWGGDAPGTEPQAASRRRSALPRGRASEACLARRRRVGGREGVLRAAAASRGRKRAAGSASGSVKRARRLGSRRGGSSSAATLCPLRWIGEKPTERRQEDSTTEIGEGSASTSSRSTSGARESSRWASDRRVLSISSSSSSSSSSRHVHRAELRQERRAARNSDGASSSCGSAAADQGGDRTRGRRQACGVGRCRVVTSGENLP